jgi:hypothetical protein
MKLSRDEIKERADSFSNRWGSIRLGEAQARSFATDLLKVVGADDQDIEAANDINPALPQEEIKSLFFWREEKIAVFINTGEEHFNLSYSRFKNYIRSLFEGTPPRLWIVSDYEDIFLYFPIERKNYRIKTKSLPGHIKILGKVAGLDANSERGYFGDINAKAAEKLATLHDELKACDCHTRDLKVYIARLLFCFFADQTGIFSRGSFIKYLESSLIDDSELSSQIFGLFKILNKPEEDLNKEIRPDAGLKESPRISGDSFKDPLELGKIDSETRALILDSAKFEWVKISPAIFGEMFQAITDKKERRDFGVHYTSEKNILKLINPLFMDRLKSEFMKVKRDPMGLQKFLNKISGLKFLDPACGSGNFLIITYRELRLLELEVLKSLRDSRGLSPNLCSESKVGPGQFYGIEAEDFPAQIARVGMRLTDLQMNALASEELGDYYSRPVVPQSPVIVRANALEIDWESVVPKRELSHILGNPPFIGYSNQRREQKRDVLKVCGLGKVDYVAAWYFKAVDYIQETDISCAFVSTNSITQGEQAGAIWKPLMDKGARINFGVKAFKWNSLAKGMAAVHCVIIGFSLKKTRPNINQYLIEAPTVFICARSKPICDVPPMVYGNKLVDGGFLTLTPEERREILNENPSAEKYIRPLIGSTEFINNIERYCLWLIGADPHELLEIPKVMERVEKVRLFRLSSNKLSTRRFAEKPYRFMETRQPDTDYVLVPRVSSENRQYIPIGFVSPEKIASDSAHIIPEAGLCHFGVLTSKTHMAWVKAVCGRLKSDFRYSKDIVYNNFPWPLMNTSQKLETEKAAQGVIDARKDFPDSSLACLYNPRTMPEKLRQAHNILDEIVLNIYGFSLKEQSDSTIVAKLMERYQKLTNQKS